MSDETLKKFSNIDNFHNRNEIIKNLTDKELGLISDGNPFSTELINKYKNIKSWDNISLEDRDNMKHLLKIEPDILIDQANDLANQENKFFFEELIKENINESLNEIINSYGKKMSKLELVSKLTEKNPRHIDLILSKVTDNMFEQLEYWKERLSDNNFNKVEKILEIEDLNEREKLSKNINVRDIKILSSINQHHNKLLRSIKSKSSINNDDDKKESESRLFD